MGIIRTYAGTSMANNVPNRPELDQTTGIGSRGTFWRPVGGRWAELFALVFMRDLGSSPVAASIKKPRMRSYQTACSVLLGARQIIQILAQSEGRD